jgi:hypothetical protein
MNAQLASESDESEQQVNGGSIRRVQRGFYLSSQSRLQWHQFEDAVEAPKK